MKKCLCCGTEAVSEAHTCANCGEGSWSESIVETPIAVEPIENEQSPDRSGHSFDSTDPETAVEVPARRRRNR